MESFQNIFGNTLYYTSMHQYIITIAELTTHVVNFYDARLFMYNCTYIHTLQYLRS